MQEFKEVATDGRMTVTMSGRRVVFRVPDLEDLLLLDNEFPLLEGEETVEEQAADATKLLEDLTKDPDKMVRYLSRVNKLLSMVSIDPKLINKPDFEKTDKAISVRALRTQDRLVVFLALMGAAGFDDMAAVEIGPLSATGDSLSLSTPSGNDSESSPTKLSKDEPENDSTVSSNSPSHSPQQEQA